ncbi:MAG: BCD family MFS transporter [Gluconacetobacter diazotrophicus]|nr:BCD family MFS transporter [Gluconacetobacter diazotrophicus]
MSAAPRRGTLGTLSVLRLGLVQAALGGMAVLATVTLNRVMVVEEHLPAVLPAALVALHYAVQLLRPAMGHGSDGGRRRVPWIRGGTTLMAASAVAAAGSVLAIGAGHRAAGIAAAVGSYAALGIGVGTAGTALLALLGSGVAPERRPAAAATVWITMIAGIAVTAGVCGALLQPFSPARLLRVVGGAALVAAALGWLGTTGIERRPASAPEPARNRVPFVAALSEAWNDPAARRFTGFVLLSMLAYSAEEILLEPFAGAVFALPPGTTAGLTALQHGGALAGMLLVALVGTASGAMNRRRSAALRALSLRSWCLGGCLLSGAALAALALGGLWRNEAALRPACAALGFGNGVFAVAAIGAMMQLAGDRGHGGLRIGLWGAAQAVAFAAGGLGAAGAADLARLLLPDPARAYGAVLLSECALFVLAAIQARAVFAGADRQVVGASGRDPGRNPGVRAAPPPLRSA